MCIYIYIYVYNYNYIYIYIYIYIFTRSFFSLAHEVITCLARPVAGPGTGTQFIGKAHQNARDASRSKSLIYIYIYICKSQSATARELRPRARALGLAGSRVISILAILHVIDVIITIIF